MSNLASFFNSSIYRTGATGYIGGSVLAALIREHPDYDFTVLLRTMPVGFHQQFPNVKVVLGDFDSSEAITNAAGEADIAIRSLHCP
jgi:uncharacterized protein YbjT (DUF2867 family)